MSDIWSFVLIKEVISEEAGGQMRMTKNTLPEDLCSGIVCLADILRHNQISKMHAKPTQAAIRKIS
jgi:hypothetical protein